jgi:hydrogenase expression/formation protein HypD
MKHIDEYRDPDICRELIDRILRRSTRSWTIMEVCGGQTHSLVRHGLDEELQRAVELIHGPGCPVCVTSCEAIDQAIACAGEPNVIVATFGDMLRVPGSRGSLLDARSRGGDVRLVYSPIDAISLAESHPGKEVVFLSVGFETTAAATALALLQANSRRLPNYSVLVAHVRVLPAMEILAASSSRIQGFLAAGHVCTVDGYTQYQPLVDQYRLPVVVAGFEPVDLLLAIDRCVEQLESNSPRLENCYPRSVRPDGNRDARRIIEKVYQIADADWRGIGRVPNGGLELRTEFELFDVRRRSWFKSEPIVIDERCLAGDVLTGRIKPPACPYFGNACHPEHPLGAPMVSAEGVCAAYMRYRNAQPDVCLISKSEVAQHGE